VIKIFRKFVENEGVIWNNFCNCNFFWFSTDFEIFNRFRVKSSLTELWSISLVATAIETSPELHCGQGVLHGALWTLHYDLVDLHNLTPTIEQVIAFTMWLSDKQISAKRGLKSGLYSHLWTLETIVSPAPKFIKICTHVYHDIANKFYFGSWD
jgi:hypothetical protein